MATRRFMTGPGEQLADVTQAVGAATATKDVELTVELAASKNGDTVAMSKEDVLLAIDRLKLYIIQNIWPPA